MDSRSVAKGAPSAAGWPPLWLRSLAWVRGDEYEWRGAFTNDEVNALHAEAFGTKVYDEAEWNWVELVHRHSLGWVTARNGTDLVGFVNVRWDGLVRRE